MSAIQKIENILLDVYQPVKAIVVYRSPEQEDTYAESFDFNRVGEMINAHPLSVSESTELANLLLADSLQKNRFLQSNGLMPKNVLYVNPAQNGYAIWHTPAMKANLFFQDSLTIPNGLASVPPMVWKATQNKLQVFALSVKSRPRLTTKLYHAPFFNVYQNGSVCMGSVSIEIDQQTSLESFMEKWQNYFFGSIFTHLLGGTSPVKGNIVQLWQGLVDSDQPFPLKSLIKINHTLKSLIS